MYLIILFFLIPVLLSILGVLLVRRYTNLSSLETHNDVAGFIYAVVGVLYGLMLAFVVVEVWDDFKETETYIHMEANSLVNVCRDVEVFPEPARSEIQGNILTYARQIIDLEFPAIKNNTVSNEAENTYNKIWANIYKYKPENSFDQMWYQETIQEMNEFDKNRKLRIFSTEQVTPTFMWVVLIAGAVLTIGFSYLFGTKNLWAHIIMVFTLSSMIWLIIFLVSEYDHPFGGLINITPEAYERSVRDINSFINN